VTAAAVVFVALVVVFVLLVVLGSVHLGVAQLRRLADAVEAQNRHYGIEPPPEPSE
jgi:hypothetical protein